MSKINDIEELPKGNFPIRLILIQKYQWSEPSIKAKYKYGMYHKGYFHQGSNIDPKLITCNYKIVIPSKLQIYVLHWYPKYLLHPGMDITDVIIFQNLYWTNIIDAVQKEVTNCQRKKL